MKVTQSGTRRKVDKLQTKGLDWELYEEGRDPIDTYYSFGSQSIKMYTIGTKWGSSVENI
jgi:hypothetical protein